jgi:hypothetical protein
MTAHRHKATLGLPSGVMKDSVTGSAMMRPNGAQGFVLVKAVAHVTRLINVKPHARHYKYTT